MGYKKTDSCLAKAGDDEPIFVLRAQDRLAPGVVRQWCLHARHNGVEPAKIREAAELADKMEAWQDEHGAKVPD